MSTRDEVGKNGLWYGPLPEDYDIDTAGEPAPYPLMEGSKKLRLSCAYLLGFGVGVLLVLAALQVKW